MKRIFNLSLLVLTLWWTWKIDPDLTSPTLFQAGSTNTETQLSLPQKPATEVHDLEQPKTLKELTLPALNNEALRAEALNQPKQDRRTFAKARKVAINLHQHGSWTGNEQIAQWQFEVESSGADSLNFGFSQFSLPPGAELRVSSLENLDQEFLFTARDNESHGQLWTPLLAGDRARFKLEVPRILASQVELHLAQVSHGFLKVNTRTGKMFGESSSSPCNIDVICSASDDATFGPMIDLYRDQIRAVAAYTLNGIETCSGALINNTARDNKPYFLTANHCGINDSNAASVVAYWNFENSTCRPVGSTDSGSDGDGLTTQFNTGAIFRAANADSDFCLIEFDDSIDPETRPFFAGWSREDTTTEMAVGIHHPAVSEKRISFDSNPSVVTAYSSDVANPSSTHLRIADWNFGTTEGGSSGSPLFDQNGRIVGQLHGGGAACGNDLPDWYGRVAISWSRGTTSSARLSDWLDPGNTANQFIDGINADELLSVESLVVTETDADTQQVDIVIRLSEATNETVTIRLRTADGTASVADGDYTALDQVLIFQPGMTEVTVTLTIAGDTTPEENETIMLSLSEASNAIAGEPQSVTILNNDFIAPVITSADSVEGFRDDPFVYTITAQNTPTSYELENAPDGMTVNETTGLVNWTPPTTGEFSFTVVARNPADAGRQVVTINVKPNSLAEALDLSPETTVTNGNPGWFLQTTQTADAQDAAQSRRPAAGGSSTFSLEVMGPIQVSFQWRVSSEEGFDELFLELDGVIQHRISGEQDWEEVIVDIPSGTRQLSWRYSKDGSVSAGADAGWVDQIEFIGSDFPVIFVRQPPAILRGQPVEIGLDYQNPPSEVSIPNLPSWLALSADNRTLAGIPIAAGGVTFQIRANNAVGEATREVSITVSNPSLSLPLALDQPELIVTTSSPGSWTRVSASGSIGGTAARSGAIGNNGITEMTMFVRGPGAMTFDWMVSSETEFDFLALSVDGQVVESISGIQPWRSFTLPLPPRLLEITFLYTKDFSLSEGEDLARVDNIQFTGFAAFALENGINPLSSTAQGDADGDQWNAFQEYALGGDINDAQLPLSDLLQWSSNNTLSFEARANVPDVRFQLQQSETLREEDWEDVSLSLSENPQTGPLSQYRSEEIPRTQARLFFRLVPQPSAQ